MKTSHHNTIHDFFQTFSHIIIILPVIIVVFAILLKVTKSDINVTEKRTLLMTSQTASSPILQKKMNINLQGPSVCLFKTQEASRSGFIQNRMISAVSTDKVGTTYYLIRNDCFYTWEKNKYNGEKICGIGQFLSIGENLINSGLMNEEMFNMLSNQSKIKLPLPLQYGDIQKMLSACKPTKTIPLKQFELPKQVLFKSK